MELTILPIVYILHCSFDMTFAYCRAPVTHQEGISCCSEGDNGPDSSGMSAHWLCGVANRGVQQKPRRMAHLDYSRSNIPHLFRLVGKLRGQKFKIQ